MRLAVRRIADAEIAHPYFSKAVQAFEDPVAELGVLAAVLRAASMVHQSHHWQTSGPSYYGDHIMFERIYNDSVPFIDQMAEKAMGLGHPALVCVETQAGVMNYFINQWCQKAIKPPTPDSMVGVSLLVEQCVVSCLKVARDSLEAKDTLTNGLDNLLQGVADKHEEFLYLLQQRAGGQTGIPYVYQR